MDKLQKIYSSSFPQKLLIVSRFHMDRQNLCILTLKDSPANQSGAWELGKSFAIFVWVWIRLSINGLMWPYRKTVTVINEISTQLIH